MALGPPPPSGSRHVGLPQASWSCDSVLGKKKTEEERMQSQWGCFYMYCDVHFSIAMSRLARYAHLNFSGRIRVCSWRDLLPTQSSRWWSLCEVKSCSSLKCKLLQWLSEANWNIKLVYAFRSRLDYMLVVHQVFKFWIYWTVNSYFTWSLLHQQSSQYEEIDFKW